MSGRRRKKAIPDGYAAACKAYRFRAYPALPQLLFIRRNFGCARKVYNLILADNTEKHGKDEDWDGEYDQHTPAEYKGRFPYLKEADSFALLNAQLDVENAFANHRKNPGHFGFPNFRAKHFSRKSYTTNIVRYKRKEKDAEGNEVLIETANIELSGNYLKLPKAGWLKLRMHRQIPADAAMKSVTVTEEPSGAVYVSILTEKMEKIRKGFYEEISEEAEAAKTKPSEPFRILRVAGLDYSSPHFFVSSDGYAADMPHWFRLSEEKLAMEQQKLSRKVPYSCNYLKQKKRIARLHEHIAAQRRDWQEKEALKLAERYDVICVEDIDYKGMAGSLKLGKSTNDNGFGQFLSILDRKLKAKGGVLIRISRWEPTTKTCQCGYVNPDVKLGMQTITCPACGRTYDRDRNAAMNILKAGMKILLEEIENRGTHGVRLTGEIPAGSSIFLCVA